MGPFFYVGSFFATFSFHGGGGGFFSMLGPFLSLWQVMGFFLGLPPTPTQYFLAPMYVL